MNSQRHLDDELARFTDEVLAKRSPTSNEELQELEVIVQHLHRLIKPDVLPTEQFHERLTNRLTNEWSMVQNQRTANRFRPRPMQIITLAASVAVVLLASVLLLSTTETTSGTTATTLFGSPALVITLMLTAAVVGIAAFAVWRRNR